MSRLEVFDESDGKTALLDTRDGGRIAAELAGVNVRYARWATREIGSVDILTAYAPEITRLKAEGGYRSVDTITVTPRHPDRANLRLKFLSEHTHDEDEVRFFVAGEGLFSLHADGRVYNVLCTQGDLISVPAGMRHWFDMGPSPSFTAIRLFRNTDGWIARFTGDTIADRFPRHQPTLA